MLEVERARLSEYGNGFRISRLTVRRPGGTQPHQPYGPDPDPAAPLASPSDGRMCGSAIPFRPPH